MLMLVLGAETGHPFACIGGGRSSGLTFVPFRPPSGLPPRSLPMDPSSLALNFSVTTIMPDWRIGALVRFLANAMRPGKPVILDSLKMCEKRGRGAPRKPTSQSPACTRSPKRGRCGEEGERAG